MRCPKTRRRAPAAAPTRGRLESIAALVLLLGLAVAAGPGARNAAGEPSANLTVFAAASLSDAFGEIGRTFERQHPGLKVRFNFAGSQQLASQIDQGATVDLFASADERWMDFVRDRHLILGDPAIFARNQLVVIVPRTNPARIRRLQDLARGGVKLVLAADAVPVGRYSRMVLRNLAAAPAFGKDFAARTLRNVVSEEENVKSVVGKVQIGEADAGFVYRSDVGPGVARLVRVFEIPKSANVTASYPIAVINGAPRADAARELMDLVLSRAGQEILRRHGFPTGPRGGH